MQETKMKSISIAIAAVALMLAGSAAYADSAAALKALDPDNDLSLIHI